MPFRSLLALATLSLIIACSPISVQRTGGSASDLTDFNSYRWNLPPLDDPGKYAERAVVFDVSMRNAISSQMASRGFQKKAQTEAADLIFDYRLQFRPEAYAEDIPTDYGLIWQRGESGEVEMRQNRPMGDPDVMLERATLLVTVYSSDKSDVLWVMEADRLLEKGRDISDLDVSIQKVVAKMFKEFPAGSE